MSTTIDETDRRILRALQRDGRKTNVEIAAEVGLSPTPCLRRIRILEERGVISRYVALLNPEAVDLGLSVFVRVWLTGQDAKTVSAFIAAVERSSSIVECHLMAGDCDYILRVVSRDMTDYRRFQMEIMSKLPGVMNFKTDIPMQLVKWSTELPI
ncbi:AsnC family transcriptional regulator [Ketogulonicigenium robustum]|uniref:AsnC family transcriptional regulator n=1 Tax=Ketogulonicigenium robustum TaxID=92947 RepID=A0A1W6NXH6_9RHOB|nr:Lrp/AsnC family transcriptional regulator [Ketogulonicigenium robustum]ARO13800.1 AsnC family transcriptional regulator [Ketogulonicigenium robustum]